MSLQVACAIAVATPVGPLTIPYHTETWAYDDAPTAEWCNGGYGASPALVRRWLTYAETSCGPQATKALSDCHESLITYCTVLAYLDPNRVWPLNPLPRGVPTQEDWWLHQPGHTDSAHRLKLTSSYGAGYILNQTTPAVQRRVQGYLRTDFNSWDGVLVDDTGGSMASQFWGTGERSSEEITSDAGVLTEHRLMAGVLTHSDGTQFVQVDNRLSANPYVPTTLPLLDDPSRVVGLMAENEPWAEGTMQPYYTTLLDEMAYVDSRPNDFIVLLSHDHDGPALARRLQEATVLLGYKPGHVVDWADLEQNNLDLAVWPEEGIYPRQPIESMGAPGGSGCLAGTGVVCSTGGHNDLEVATGVFRREFGVCYDQGMPFGRCAAIVNDTSRPVSVSPSWLSQPYSHQITMTGGDVQSGGTIDTAGARFSPGSTTIPAHDALLLAG